MLNTQIPSNINCVNLLYIIGFIYLFFFYVAFNTVQVISRRVVGRAEETSTYSSLGFYTVNCRPMASNYQLSHLRPCRESNPGLRGGRRQCYHSSTVAPVYIIGGHIFIPWRNILHLESESSPLLLNYISERGNYFKLERTEAQVASVGVDHLMILCFNKY